MAMATPLALWMEAQRDRVQVSSEIDPTKLCGSDDRCIHARTAIKSGQTLVTLHPGAYLNGATWLDDMKASSEDRAKQASDIKTMLDGKTATGTLRTVLALLTECTMGKDSKFCGYIEQLPQELQLPLGWTADELKRLKDTSAVHSIDDDIVNNLFKNDAKPLMEQFPSIWDAGCVSLAKFQWAYGIVSSRAFNVADNMPTLLPVIDMANHAAVSPAAKIEKGEKGALHVVTIRDIAQNDPVTISYGELSNAQLLCRYGFVLPVPTPLDAILLSSRDISKAYDSVLADESDGDEEQRRKRRRVDATGPEQFFTLVADEGRNYGLSSELLEFVMGQRLPMEALHEALAVALRAKDQVYSERLDHPPTAGVREQLVAQLIRHERDICRKVLFGIMSLEEQTDDDEEEEDDESDDADALDGSSVTDLTASDDDPAE